MDRKKALGYYENAGIGRRMGFGKRPCILVVDFQKGFTDSRYPLAARLDREIANTCEILSVARRRGVPVFFTVIAYDNAEQDGGRYFDKIPSLKMLLKGTSLVELDERLTPQLADQVIEKKYPSAFFGTRLTSLLHELGIDTTILCGCVTSSCIRATAVDAMQHGFYTIIARECVGDRLSESHEASLFDLDMKFADVVPKQGVIKYLENLPVSLR